MTDDNRVQPRKARDLLALAEKRREDSSDVIRHSPGFDEDAEAEATWMRESDRLPARAREDDDVEPLDYRVDIGPYEDGGDGWRILRGGALVGYCHEGGLLFEWSLEAPEPHDIRNYDPMA